MILGLIRAGRIEDAWQAFKRITPGYFSGENYDPKQNMPPYIYANGSYGPDHKNNSLQMEYTWITGSVAWFYNVITKEMLGIKPDFYKFVIDPRFPASWNEVNVTRYFRGKNFDIKIQRKAVNEITLNLNGKVIQGNQIHLDQCQQTNEVIVHIPEAQTK